MARRPQLTTATLISDPFPRVQLANSNPAQWNTEWETFYELHAALTKPDYIMRIAQSDRQRSMMFGRLSSSSSSSPSPSKSRTEDKHGYLINYQSTFDIQDYVGRSAVDARVNLDFEHKWLRAPVAERRKHALVGLANAGAQAKNLNAARACCADILRVGYLSEEGEVVLGLLREVVTRHSVVNPGRKEPYWFPNGEWEEVRERLRSNPKTTEDEKFDLLEVLMLRAKLIYLVLQGIMASFLSKPLPSLSVYKEKDRRPQALKKQEVRFLKKEHAMLYGEDGARRLREELATMSTLKSRRKVHCENCCRAQGEEERFMRCKKCWDEIKREVKYCKKECQAADWRARHKQICGKPVSSMDEFLNVMLPPASSALPSSQSQFGPPHPGFTRTPQLAYHIIQIDARPDIAFVVHTKPSQKIELELLCPQVLELFRKVRKVAFEEGRREAVAKVCHYVVWFLRVGLEDVRYGWDLNYAVDVMEEEFGVGDLRRALKEMQELQVADEFHRPPLLFPMSYPEWREIFLEDDARFGGKLVLDRPLDEAWEIKMSDSQVKRVPGIWEGKTRVWGHEAAGL